MAKKGYTHIDVVLDRSFSMRAVQSKTVEGFNSFLHDQVNAPGAATISLVKFNNSLATEFTFMPVGYAPRLTLKNYKPHGNTALLDAVGLTMKRTGEHLAAMPENERPEKVIFVIVTDGEENASHQFTREQVFEMIEHQKSKYGWEFVFLGANQDAIRSGGSIAVNVANSMTYAHNAAGTEAMFDALADNTRRYRAGEVRCMAFTADQRTAQATAGAGEVSNG